MIDKYCISQRQCKEGFNAIHRSLSYAEYLEGHPQMRIVCLCQLISHGIQVRDTGLVCGDIQKDMEIVGENRLGIDYVIGCWLYRLYPPMRGRYDEDRGQLNQVINRSKPASLDAQNYILNLAVCYNHLSKVKYRQQNLEHPLGYHDRTLETYSDRKYPKNPTFYSDQVRALLMLGKKKWAADRFFTSNKLYDASNILIGYGITKSYCTLLYAAEGNFRDLKLLLTEVERYTQILASPVSLDILEWIKAVLIKNYPEGFTDVIPKGFEACCANVEKYMKHLPEAYGLYLPLELADTTI